MKVIDIRRKLIELVGEARNPDESHLTFKAEAATVSAGIRWIPISEYMPDYGHSVVIRIRNQADKKYDSWSMGYHTSELWYYDFGRAADPPVNQDDGYYVSDWFDPFTLPATNL